MKYATPNIVNYLPFDISAEEFVIELIEAGKVERPEQIITLLRGSISDKTGYEISNLSEGFYSNEESEILKITIKREGIYEELSEEMFLEPPSQENDEVTYEKQREESLSFFVPFEQAIYIARYYKALLNRKIELFPSSIFELQILEKDQLEFLESNFDKKIVNLIAYYYSLRSKFMGNWEKTSTIFGLITDKEVVIHEAAPLSFTSEENLEGEVGSCRLGEDSILGNSFQDGIPTLKIEIGDIDTSEIQFFLPIYKDDNIGKKKYRYLIEKICYPIFIPMGYNIITEIKMNENETPISILNSENDCILGYTTQL